MEKHEMNTMKLKKNSWHYKLVKNFSDVRPEAITDFCSYFREVVWSLFGATFLTAIGICVFYVSVVAPLMYLTVGLQHGWFQMPYEVITGLSIDLVALFVVIIGETIHRRRVKENAYYDIHGHFPKRSQGFFSLAWAKFKDKTCHKIEFN
jgi:hypothetical protein